MRTINYINGLEGVAAGGVATANLPVNRRYHSLKLNLSATVGGSPSTDPTAILNYVRLIVNGTVMRDLTPGQIIKIAALNGITAAAGELPIYFSEPWRASVVGEEATSWDMFGQTKATIEISFKTTAVAPACKIIAAYDFARNVTVDAKTNAQSFFLSIVKQLNFTYNAPSGQYDLTTLPIRFPIQRILLQTSTGTISAVEVYRDNEKVHEGLAAENSEFLKDYEIDASQFSFPVVFDFEQQVSSALLVDRELNVRPTFSAANTVSVVVEHRANGYV